MSNSTNNDELTQQRVDFLTVVMQGSATALGIYVTLKAAQQGVQDVFGITEWLYLDTEDESVISRMEGFNYELNIKVVIYEMIVWG